MIEVKNLSFKAQNREILSKINLKIDKGDFVAVVGPNGAGKSTLLKIIIDLIDGYEGNVLIENTDNKTWLKRNVIGYLPQAEAFDKNFPATAEDLVLMGLVGKVGLFRKFSKEDRKMVDEVLGYVGMMEFKNTLIGRLSGGEFQRILIARALISDSDYLFLDEPEAGVDSGSIAEFYNLLLNLNKMGKTIVLISHDINMVLKYSTHLVCLNKTLHSHTRSELVTSEMITRAYGEVMQIVEKGHY